MLKRAITKWIDMPIMAISVAVFKFIVISFFLGYPDLLIILPVFLLFVFEGISQTNCKGGSNPGFDI